MSETAVNFYGAFEVLCKLLKNTYVNVKEREGWKNEWIAGFASTIASNATCVGYWRHGLLSRPGELNAEEQIPELERDIRLTWHSSAGQGNDAKSVWAVWTRAYCCRTMRKEELTGTSFLDSLSRGNGVEMSILKDKSRAKESTYEGCNIGSVAEHAITQAYCQRWWLAWKSECENRGTRLQYSCDVRISY